MWQWFVAATSVILSLDTAHSEAGLSSTSFNSHLRGGFTRLFQNGFEQPAVVGQQPPFVALNPVEYHSPITPLVQQPDPFGPLSAPSGYHQPRPRYELQYQSWVIPYYYVPTRYHPPRGGKRPNDVLVLVLKSSSNCTDPAANGTKPADADPADEGDADGDDDDGPNPDDDVEVVTVVTGGVEKGKEPSRCVWAILSCCAPANTPIRYTCFDVLGCSAAFWDTNPCVPAIVQTALDQANKYYLPVNRTMTPATTQPPAAADPSATDNVATDLMAALTGATSPPAVADDTATTPTA